MAIHTNKRKKSEKKESRKRISVMRRICNKEYSAIKRLTHTYTQKEEFKKYREPLQHPIDKKSRAHYRT